MTPPAGFKEKIATGVYRLFLATAGLRRIPLFSAIWQMKWKISLLLFSGTRVSTLLHGRFAVLNFGHPYPVYARQYRSFNNPLIELVYQAFLLSEAPVTLIDAGAGVGDTVLLLQANCPGMIRNFYAVEGDAHFFGYLEENVGSLAGAHLFKAMLSGAEGNAPSLVRHHAGTASATGETKVRAVTLDALIPEPLGGLEVLKTDVDGFDGRVLAGASGILERYRPAVIFEWHPALYEKAGNPVLEPFQVLKKHGYCDFLWFDRWGHFSHVLNTSSAGWEGNIEAYLPVRDREDHFDVIALHEQSRMDRGALKQLSFAKSRKSFF